MTTPATPTTMVARSPEDILAVVPIVLGFVPRDSVVMLTFGARHAFHARLDLPPPEDVADALPEVVAALLEPACRHRVRRVVLVLYSDDAALAGQVHGALLAGFEGAGIAVVEALRADGRRWFPLQPGRASAGIPYDVSTHPFAAQAVLDGRVTLRSREELAAGLAPLPDRVAAVRALLGDDPRRVDRPAAEAAWVRATVAAHVPAGTVPQAREAGRLLRALCHPVARDAAWLLVDRETARDHVAFWTDLVRRSPGELVPAPAALLGFSAWLAGHGALAWCAVDVCLAAEPGHRLAGLLSTLLAEAVPPAAWDRDPGRPEALDDLA